MKSFILKDAKKILKNKKLFEKKLGIKISSEGRKITIHGNELDEYLSSRMFEAIGIGFPVDIALLLLDQEYLFEKIEIKNLTKRKNLKEIRARIIGTNGRTKGLIEELSGCYISLHSNSIGVIGEADRIKSCTHALTKIIQGSRQSSVYSYLEKQRKIYYAGDLGLRER